MQGLEAGADDFLTKPVDDIALVTRVKNLARLKIAERRDDAAGGDGQPRSACCRRPCADREAAAAPGRVLLVEDQSQVAKRMRRRARQSRIEVDVEPDLQTALLQARRPSPTTC